MTDPPGEVTHLLPVVIHAMYVTFVWSCLDHMHLTCSLLMDLLFLCIVSAGMNKHFKGYH